MKRLLAVFALLLAAAAGGERPGWLGFGFDYHRATAPASGWMVVLAVAPNSPAAKGGLQPQDLITQINKKPLQFATDADLLAALGKIRAGEKVTFRVRRGTATIDATVTAAPMSDEMYRLWQRNQALAKHP